MTKSPSRSPKSIRITEEQQQLLDRLLLQFPDVTSESDLIYRAFVEGLYVLAARATVPGRGVLHGGLSAAEVAGHVERMLIELLPFVVAHGTLLPTLLAEFQQLGLTSGAAAQTPAPATAPTFEQDAQRDADGLGAEFL